MFKPCDQIGEFRFFQKSIIYAASVSVSPVYHEIFSSHTHWEADSIHDISKRKHGTSEICILLVFSQLSQSKYRLNQEKVSLSRAALFESLLFLHDVTVSLTYVLSEHKFGLC